MLDPSITGPGRVGEAARPPPRARAFSADVATSLGLDTELARLLLEASEIEKRGKVCASARGSCVSVRVSVLSCA